MLTGIIGGRSQERDACPKMQLFLRLRRSLGYPSAGWWREPLGPLGICSQWPISDRRSMSLRSRALFALLKSLHSQSMSASTTARPPRTLLRKPQGSPMRPMMLTLLMPPTPPRTLPTPPPRPRCRGQCGRDRGRRPSRARRHLPCRTRSGDPARRGCSPFCFRDSGRLQRIAKEICILAGSSRGAHRRL